MVANTQKRHNISGSVFVTTRINGQDMTAPGVMLVQWPNKIRLELEDAVGSTLGLVVVNDDRFWIYQKDQPEIITGPLSKIPGGLGLLSRAGELIAGVLARPPLEHQGKPTFVEHGIEHRFPAGRRTVTWASASLEPSTYVEDGAEAKTSFLYLDYEARAGVSFPKKIQVIREFPRRESETLTVVWRDWQPFVPEEKKLFQIPQQQTFGRKIKALR